METAPSRRTIRQPQRTFIASSVFLSTTGIMQERILPYHRKMSDDVSYPALYLKRGEDARLRTGHLWVFSNEVDVKRSPLTAFEPGERCVIVDSADKAVGVGYVNPNSLIAARLVNRGVAHALDRSLLVHKCNVALSLRERL